MTLPADAPVRPRSNDRSAPLESAEYSPAEIVGKMEEFLQENVNVVALADSDDPRVVVDLKLLNRFDPDLVAFTFRHPRRVLAAATEALVRLTPSDAGPIDWVVRLGNPMAILEDPVHISALRSEHLGRLLVIPGIVTAASPVLFKLYDAVYTCLRCGGVVREAQPGEVEHEPLECYQDQGGCGRSAASTKFQLVEEASTFLNAQRVEIQEPPETTHGRLPEKLPCHLFGNDIVNKLRGGPRVRIWGILLAQVPRGRERRTAREKFLEVQGFDILDETPEEIPITPTERERIERLVLERGDAVYGDLVQSVAPHLVGLEVQKEAIVLQMFGGVEKARPDGRGLLKRGSIHGLLAGDPSTAKTALITAAAAIAPRGRVVTASQATHIGLTAYVQQENVFGATRWVVEAGELPLSDRAGLLCIDEFDKMNPEDRRRINPALDPQDFTVVKAGANLRLVSRVPVLAAANPKLGRFVAGKDLYDSIDITPDTLSRFDFIFPILDLPNDAWDSRVADMVLDGGGGPAPIDTDTFQKLIAMARSVEPRIGSDVQHVLKTYYMDQRRKSRGVIRITPRQLGALRRLAEASARVQLRPAVWVTDAERAIRIMETWLRAFAGDGAMSWDIDSVMTGMPASQREQIVLLRDIIAELGGTETGEGAAWGGIMELAERRGIPRDRAEAWLRKWRQEGDLYSPVEGRFKLVTKL